MRLPPAHDETPSLDEILHAIRTLDPDRSPPDEYVVKGQEIYFHLRNGVARSKLTNQWFDRQLGNTITSRNWKTTRKLLEMARA